MFGEGSMVKYGIKMADAKRRKIVQVNGTLRPFKPMLSSGCDNIGLKGFSV